MHRLTPLQVVLLVLLTLCWGVNWPVMKLGVTGFPPFTFRAASMVIGALAAALGVTLLLWYEFTGLAGHPAAVALALFAACVWALGTQLLRRSRAHVPTLTLSFWMTVITAVALSLGAAAFESARWQPPPRAVTWAILYNAVLIFGYAHAAWFSLARSLPPVASTLSVMFIPVLGVFTGALWLGEVLHWQDWAAVVLMVVAIASVLWPAREPVPAR